MAEPFIGEIRQFAGNFAPQGWALCNGSLISISDNGTLFQLIGTVYGGDGQNTFALPDLRGRVPIHQGNGFVIGQAGGFEQVTLGTAEMPTHTHVPTSASAGNNAKPAGNVWASSANGATIYGTAPGTVSMNATSVSAIGNNQPHENRIPFQAVTYIISLYGIFPSPN